MRYVLYSCIFLSFTLSVKSALAISLSVDIPQAIGIVGTSPQDVPVSFAPIFDEINQVDLTVTGSFLSGAGEFVALFPESTNILRPFVVIDTNEATLPSFEIRKTFRTLGGGQPNFDFLLDGMTTLEFRNEN